MPNFLVEGEASLVVEAGMNRSRPAEPPGVAGETRRTEDQSEKKLSGFISSSLNVELRNRNAASVFSFCSSGV